MICRDTTAKSQNLSEIVLYKEGQQWYVGKRSSLTRILDPSIENLRYSAFQATPITPTKPGQDSLSVICFRGMLMSLKLINIVGKQSLSLSLPLCVQVVFTCMHSWFISGMLNFCGLVFNLFFVCLFLPSIGFNPIFLDLDSNSDLSVLSLYEES